MKLEIHILQNFAPSNLNRDDTGSPKDCELGGVRRGRISSQCYKRAIRDAFAAHDLVPEAERAARTKRLVEHVGSRVAAAKRVDEEVARRATTKAIEAAGLKTDEKNDKTQYLLFLPKSAIDALANVVSDHFDVLADGAPEPDDKSDEATKKPAKGKAKKEKGEAKQGADPALQKAVLGILKDASRTPELALFGRMIADAPDWNMEAACQVAHAVSTNRVSMEFDFYTAIDDLKKGDTAGSDMMGTIPFNSACFYRYLTVDVNELVKNLGADDAAKAQARRTVSALIRAAALAIPSGKQNSMAAQNPPSLVLVDVRDRAEPRSLANAFVEPVRPGRDGDLVSQSVQRLAGYAASLDQVYGAKGRKDLSFMVVDPDKHLAKTFSDRLPAAHNRGSLDAVVEASVGAAFGGGA